MIKIAKNHHHIYKRISPLSLQIITRHERAMNKNIRSTLLPDIKKKLEIMSTLQCTDFTWRGTIYTKGNLFCDNDLKNIIF